MRNVDYSILSMFLYLLDELNDLWITSLYEVYFVIFIYLFYSVFSPSKCYEIPLLYLYDTEYLQMLQNE